MYYVVKGLGGLGFGTTLTCALDSRVPPSPGPDTPPPFPHALHRRNKTFIMLPGAPGPGNVICGGEDAGVIGKSVHPIVALLRRRSMVQSSPGPRVAHSSRADQRDSGAD